MLDDIHISDGISTVEVLHGDEMRDFRKWITIYRNTEQGVNEMTKRSWFHRFNLTKESILGFLAELPDESAVGAKVLVEPDGSYSAIFPGEPREKPDA